MKKNRCWGCLMFAFAVFVSVTFLWNSIAAAEFSTPYYNLNWHLDVWDGYEYTGYVDKSYNGPGIYILSGDPELRVDLVSVDTKPIYMTATGLGSVPASQSSSTWGATIAWSVTLKEKNPDAPNIAIPLDVHAVGYIMKSTYANESLRFSYKDDSGSIVTDLIYLWTYHIDVTQGGVLPNNGEESWSGSQEATWQLPIMPGQTYDFYIFADGRFGPGAYNMAMDPTIEIDPTCMVDGIPATDLYSLWVTPGVNVIPTVPLPSTLLLLGSGLVGTLGLGRIFKKG
jgi:hypothetical protein